MPYCPHCGEEVEDDDRYCIECGTELARDRSGTDSSYGWQSEPPSDGVIEPETQAESAPAPPGAATATAGRLWVPFGVALFGVVQSIVLLVYPQTLLDSAESFDLNANLSTDVVVAAGAFGLIASLLLIGLVGYYYREGALDKRYFWGLVGVGVFGVLIGNNILFLVPAAIGGYGLYAVIE